jgi:hypothetical protein
MVVDHVLFVTVPFTFVDVVCINFIAAILLINDAVENTPADEGGGGIVIVTYCHVFTALTLNDV